MPTGTIYGRYSDEEQKPTSIDDQVRRCLETASAHGISVEENFIFSDSAVSGTAKGRNKRPGYERLLDAIREQQVDVLIVDELSRVSRNTLDGALLMDLLETTGVRIITRDGIDSDRREWKMLWGLKMISAVQEVESTADRVTRGMIGQLERGYQIAQPAFGYVGVRVYSDGRELGTLWDLDLEKSEIVKQMFQWRFEGMSAARIAKRLNEEGVLPPGHKRCKGPAYWRPASAHRVLSNPVYKGIFIWNGSAFTLARAKKKRQKIKSISYERPGLRLVSDELWASCNPIRSTERLRGGGRHALAGVIHCGQCKAKLSIKGGPKTFSVHCPQCEQAKRVGGHSRFVGYTSLAAAKKALDFGLRQLFTGDVLSEFRSRLRSRLAEGSSKEEAVLQHRLAEIDQGFQKLQRALLMEGMREEWLAQQMVELGSERDAKTKLLAALRKRASHVTAEAVELQANIDPLPLIERLLDGEPEAYKVRATLRRLVERFELVEKKGRYVSVFELEFRPGACLAELTGSVVVEPSNFGFRVQVSTSSVRPTVWHAEGERL